ncbi:copper amine oxidase N-terminal domain-containing protein [Bacillus sp. FJAT-29814]|uniref:copper amine oxidase N-terminal domain-containing protein n=1 Tax=Bacillus sp. FJAT-29814 TaxID=1729688 RepID=UPI00082E7DC7|nr:copper amine oxidase N-terminal domain-containing protein [Bacillus sp. FJAT-29814]
MKQKGKWLIIFTTLFMLVAIGTPVFADDDDDDDEKYEHYQKDHDEDYDDDDNYDDEWKNTRESQAPIPSQTEFWNIWSREARNNPAQPLPIDAPTEVLLINDNTEKRLYMIPQDGQLLVSSEEFVKALGGRSKFFPLTKINVLTNGERELIVRAGSNAAYENRVKTPMPVQAVAYENSVYIPISVAANALGYRVSWDEEKTAMVLQTF